jgi:hypothetical protein
VVRIPEASAVRGGSFVIRGRTPLHFLKVQIFFFHCCTLFCFKGPELRIFSVEVVGGKEKEGEAGGWQKRTGL